MHPRTENRVRGCAARLAQTLKGRLKKRIPFFQTAFCAAGGLFLCFRFKFFKRGAEEEKVVRFDDFGGMAFGEDVEAE